MCESSTNQSSYSHLDDSQIMKWINARTLKARWLEIHTKRNRKSDKFQFRIFYSNFHCPLGVVCSRFLRLWIDGHIFRSRTAAVIPEAAASTRRHKHKRHPNTKGRSKLRQLSPHVNRPSLAPLTTLSQVALVNGPLILCRK